VEYVHWLLIVSAAFAVLERLFPWRKGQAMLRPGWLRDVVFLLGNGHFFPLALGSVFAACAAWTMDVMQAAGVRLDVSPVPRWPLWVQFLVFLVVADFLQWCVHNLLHRVPWLWTFHKVHHSITTMDWIGNFRFHWMEIVVYRAAQFVPLLLLAASPEATFWVFVAGTAWGHFNHSNLDVGLGPLGYVFNSPRMHLWHHDISSEGGPAKNFGIVLSLWDWLFGTVFWPRERSPAQLGYPGMEEMPRWLGGQLLWPLARATPADHRK
jgi:sterol desaturase/sphingolipid hydroxylase (fatty acid hydroxylase superfamily)